MSASKLNFYKKSISYILSVQRQDGSIPWEVNKKLDPWDHIEAAMGLSIGGMREGAERAYSWLARMQEPDGSWFAEYKNSIPVTKRKETNFIAYISTGVLHHYLIYKDQNFLKRIFPVVKKSVDFVLSMQTEQGDICWASEEGKSNLDDSLITGSSSIYKSLECAEYLYNLLNEDGSNVKKAKEGVRSLVQLLDEATQIVDFFSKWDEQKRVKKDIKRVVIENFDESLGYSLNPY